MLNNNIILAVVGLAGAGKTEAINYLMGRTGWEKVYFGAVTFEEMKRLGLEVNEANERAIRESLRAEFGMSAYAVKNLPKIKGLAQQGGVLVESMYSWEEYEVLKGEFGDSFKVLEIYASPQTRINRLKNRPIRPYTTEELLSRDKSQIENLHQAGPIAVADWTIINEGGQKDLEDKLEGILAGLKK